MIDTYTPTRKIRRLNTLALITTVLVRFVLHTNQVHGWTLPRASDVQRRRRFRSRSRSSRCSSIQRHKNTILFALPSTNRNKNDEDDDDESEDKFLAESDQISTNRNKSETEKELLNDIFKGASKSPSTNTPGSRQELPFLDKAYFDPYAYDDDDRSFFGKIASFVKADYELFEAVFVSCFFLILITITKDVLRAQMDAASSSTLF